MPIVMTKRLAARRKGQTILEYVLLLIVVIGAMGMLFGKLRERLFYLWICDVYPRVATPSGCHSFDNCLSNISDTTLKDELSAVCIKK